MRSIIELDNKYSVHFYSKFVDELNSLYLFSEYNLNSSYISHNFYSKFQNILLYLKYFPELFPKLQVHNKNYRKIIIDNYVIIYEVNHFKKEIYILHIFHSRQNYLDLL